jgi:predicted DNA-binding transcriptional regulator AlpA
MAKDSIPEFTIPNALRHFDSLPTVAFVREPIVLALLGISSATIRRRVKDGLFPRPKKLSKRVVAWNVGELRRSLKGHGDAP